MRTAPGRTTVRAMTRDRLERALKEGIPFVVKVADGRRYTVVDKYRIAFGATFIMLVDEKDLPHRLSLRAITDIEYLAAEGR